MILHCLLIHQQVYNIPLLFSSNFDNCQQCKLNINAQKFKVLILSKSKQNLQYCFYINQSEVEVVHSYKYLGLIITSNGSLKSSVSTLANQARKAMFVMMKKAPYLNYPPPALMCKLFDALVAPVCEYACEWWGFQEKMTLSYCIVNFVRWC